MSKKDEALKLALEALEYISSHYMSLPKIGCMALAAVEEALAEQPAQQWNAGVPSLYPEPEPGVSIKATYEQPVQPEPSAYWHSEFLKYNTTSDHRMMENAQGDLERIKLVQTGVGIGKPNGCQCPACKITPHASDCAVHNEPAYLKGACSCKAQPEQEPVHFPVTDNTYNYAKNLAEAIFKQHFASDEHYASGRIVWGVNDTVIGILTQIDNMVADMVRRPAQPEQEPVAWMHPDGRIWTFGRGLDKSTFTIPLYTSPPASKTWVGLTDDEIIDVIHPIVMSDMADEATDYEIARAIEAKLRMKNA